MNKDISIRYYLGMVLLSPLNPRRMPLARRKLEQCCRRAHCRVRDKGTSGPKPRGEFVR